MLKEHDVNKTIMFCVPIVLRERERLAEIFWVRFDSSLSVSMPHIMYTIGYGWWAYR